MLQGHFFDVLSKIPGKKNSLVLFSRKIRKSLLSSNGAFYTFSKLVLFRLLVLVVRDSVITLGAIAYSVNDTLDEVLLAIVCIVYNGNIIIRSRLVPKVAVTRTFVVSWLTCFGRSDKLDRMLKVSIPHSYIFR